MTARSSALFPTVSRDGIMGSNDHARLNPVLLPLRSISFG